MFVTVGAVNIKSAINQIAAFSLLNKPINASDTVMDGHPEVVTQSEEIGEFLEVQTRNIYKVVPTQLEVHERTLVIYGENEDRPELFASIQESGVLTPLIVSDRTGSLKVISGKCRLEVARLLGHQEIPIEIRHFETPEAEIKCLLVENLERESKTIAQRIAEGEAWHELESFNAKERQRAGAAVTNKKLGRRTQEKTLRTNLSEASITTNATVAKRVGLSSTSYKNGRKVVDFIALLRSRSSVAEASVMQDLLNKSVDGAYKVLNHPRCVEILSLIASGEAKNPQSAIAALTSRYAYLASSQPGRKMMLEEGMAVSPALRTPDLAHLGRIGSVRDETVEVWFRNLKSMEMERYIYKHSEIPMPPIEEPSTEIRSRLEAIQASGELAAIFKENVEILNTRVHFTPEEELMLEFIELCCYASSRNLSLDSEQLFNRDLLQNFRIA